MDREESIDEFITRVRPKTGAELSPVVEQCDKLIHALIGRYAYDVFLIERRLGLTMDDLSQELWAVLLRALTAFRPDQGVKFTTYFGRCVINYLVWIRRRAQAKMRQCETTSLDEDAFQEGRMTRLEQTPQLYSTYTLDDTLVDRVAIQKVVREWPRDLKIAVAMRSDGASQREIAAVLKRSQGVVSRLLARAKRQLSSVC